MATLLPPLSDVFVTICKRSYQPLVNDNDQCPITNLAAIRYGLEALLKADASDYEREQQLWELARNALTREEENLVGAGAEGTLQFADDFFMERMGELEWGRGGFYHG